MKVARLTQESEKQFEESETLKKAIQEGLSRLNYE